MEIPEIEYVAQAPSAPFNPVKAADINPGLEANQQIMMQGLQANLAQTRADRATAIQNAKNSIPVDELANFSSSLKTMLDERQEQEKQDMEAEMTMLAFTDGVTADPEFDKQEKQLESTGKKIESAGNSYERDTGDVEGAERIRNLSGWKKYYYMKAKAQMAGEGFSGWMSANAENPEMAVNVGGQMYTLASAPTAPIRQAVAAKMAATYMKPYSGLNKSFLGKYMFPGLKRGMTSTVNSYAAANAERIKANRLDAAEQSFMHSTNVAESMQQFRAELTAMGHTEAEIRGKMSNMASQFRSRNQLDTFLNTPYGPNGKTFREQYPQEAQDAISNFNSLKLSQANNGSKEREIQDAQSLEEAKQKVFADREDGSFDADPARLKELSEQARAAGFDDTANFWESQISETAAMKNSSTVREQYEMQIQAGVIPSKEEILQNPALSQDDKQKLLGKTQGDGRAEPAAGSMAKGHKEILESAIRKRGKWTRDGANDPGIKAAELRAWSEYKEVYNRELQSGASEAVAAERALSDFKSKFGTNKDEGEYALWGTEDGKVPQGRVGTFKLYDPTGTESTSRSPMSQIDEKLQYADAKTVFNSYPDLYEGEEAELKSLTQSYELTGKVGTIPPVYYELQQRYGGNVSIIDMINKRLEANGLDQLPSELTTPLKSVEESFDEETYKYINYKSNATRTDIGVISSGGDPVYASTTAAQEEIKSIFGQRESPTEGYDAMNRGVGGDSPGGGTRQLGRPLTDMTVGEIKELQASGGVNAVGRYQFIAGTLIEAADAAGITDDMPFNEAVQDRMFFVHLDRYGAQGPWEQWWIQQGGEHLRLTPEEQQKIDAFRESYDPAKPWRQAKNTRAELLHVYTSGNIGPTSTGPHLDVKQVGGGRFEETALDEYVVVDDPEFGQVSLGEIRQRTGGIGDDFDDHVARGSHGIDYGLHSGTKISLKGGAKVVKSVPSAHGDVLTIKLPDGRLFTFLHGTSK